MHKTAKKQIDRKRRISPAKRKLYAKQVFPSPGELENGGDKLLVWERERAAATRVFLERGGVRWKSICTFIS